MYQISDAAGFVSAFAEYGLADQFSVPARRALFEYYSELSENAELDILGISCDWVEHEHALYELRSEFPRVLAGVGTLEQAIHALAELTTVILVPESGTVLVQVFRG